MPRNTAGLFYNSKLADNELKDSFVGNVIRKYPAGAQPLFALSSLFRAPEGGHPTQPTHSYWVETMVFDSLTINGEHDDNDTTLVVDSTLGAIPGRTYQVPTTREIVRVTSVTDSTHVVVQRGFGRIAAAAIPDNAVLFNVGNAQTEASERPQALSTKPTQVFNYTSIYRSAWGVSNTAASSKLQHGFYDSLSKNKRECTERHTLAWEQIALFSQPLAPTTDAATNKPIHATQGVIDSIYQYAADNISTAGSTTTFAQLEEMLDVCFSVSVNMGGSRNRVLMTDRKGYKVITDIGRTMTEDKIRLDSGVNSFGWAQTNISTRFGNFEMVENPVLNGTLNGAMAGIAIAVDPRSLSVGYLNGRDAIVEGYDGSTDSIETGLDAKEGGLLTEMCVMNLVPENNALITGLTAAA